MIFSSQEIISLRLHKHEIYPDCFDDDELCFKEGKEKKIRKHNEDKPMNGVH